ARDSSYTGYVEKGLGTALLVSNGLDGSRSHAWIRYLRRSDSVLVQDTLRPYTIDSVAFLLGVIARDSSVKNLRLRLYKLPATADTAPTFAQLDALLTPDNVIDSVVVPDTIVSGIRRVLLTGDQLARVALDEEDEGVLRLGVDMAADGPTGTRIGALASGGFTPLYVTYVTAEVEDTALRQQIITRGTDRTTWASEAADPTPTDGVLIVGGAPSYRTLLRFDWPARFRDSVSIVRARLELLPTATVPGLAPDTAILQARAIIADLGAKSPILSGLTLESKVPAGTSDTVKLNVGTLVGQWQGDNARPPAIFLSLSPEASSFSVFSLGSSLDPDRVARIRLTYVLRFPFESP
ncbi:MAG TPA: hypothetical protein VFX50_03065, partial [Gemmatimonadales bacterium]|nr:hypothetical protein [Gemmatimonadales bacterium]